ncbi:MAG: DUF4446 family protein [Lachnospiraceae bacterium]|nr:DUF4446 family protein [Lachnospiraceae bacterium]MDY4969016.1 DUF4446 family protein [Lachnospiraceae bacterium]
MLENSMLNDLLFDPAYIIAALGAITFILLIMVIVCLVKLGGLKKRYKKFMEGNDAKSLEELIQSEVADIKNLQDEDTKIEDEISNMNQVISGCYQKKGVVKYDALTGMGGQVSFALAMLDQKNTGIMVNSIHTREGSYLYLKEIVDGKCEVLLGKEEQKALDIAMGVNTK